MIERKYVFKGTHPAQTAELARLLLSDHTVGGPKENRIVFTLENPRTEPYARLASGVNRAGYLSAVDHHTYVHVDLLPDHRRSTSHGIHVLVGGVHLPHEDNSRREHFAELSLPYSPDDAAIVRHYIDVLYGPALAAQEREEQFQRRNMGLQGLVRTLGTVAMAALRHIPQSSHTPEGRYIL